MSADNRARSARGDHDSPQPVIVRAGVADQAHLLTLIEEFYEIDRHPYRESRVLDGLVPLLRNDRYGQVWLIADQGKPRTEADGYRFETEDSIWMSRQLDN